MSTTITPPKPKAMPVNVDPVPAELKAIPQWCGFKWQWNGDKDKWDKPPFSIRTGRKCNSEQLAELSDFSGAVSAHRAGRFDGIGFRFRPDDPFAGVDLDGCRDPQTGAIAPWAQRWIDRFATYTEISPSGKGVKMFCRGKVSGKGKNRRLEAGAGVEEYSTGRYFTVTGNKLPDSPSTTAEAQDAIDEFTAAYWPAENSAPAFRSPSSNGVDSVLDRARKYLAKVPPAISGQGGHNATFHAACTLVHGFALSVEQAKPLLLEWNATCQPPWGEGEIDHKLADAARSDGPRGELLNADRQPGPRGERNGRHYSPGRGTGGNDKPSIVVTTDEETVANKAIKALAKRNDVFQRGGILVHVVRDQEPPRGIVRPKGAPRIMGLSRATLRERMASSAVWVRPGKGRDLEPCHVPEWAVKAVDSRGTWFDIRQLETVSETPLFRADGTILQTPGYDAASGILYEPATEFPPIPEHPSLSDAQRALKRLCEPWNDVPFASKTDLAVVVALTLTPLARHAFRGPTPLFAIESNTRGAGKTLTADASGIISTGRQLARASAPTDNDEARKLITSVVLAGERMVLLDNIGEMFGWPALDAALTGSTWSDRILGANRMLVDAPLTTVWVVTGNNMMFRADVVRRTLPLPPGIVGGVPGGAERVSPPRSNRVGHRKPGRARFGRTYRSARIPCGRVPVNGPKANGQLRGLVCVRQASRRLGRSARSGRVTARIGPTCRSGRHRAGKTYRGLVRDRRQRGRPDGGRSGQDA